MRTAYKGLEEKRRLVDSNPHLSYRMVFPDGLIYLKKQDPDQSAYWEHSRLGGD